MKTLRDLIEQNGQIRVIGFDDAPFHLYRDKTVYIAGVVCSGTRFEGMLWGEVEKDGVNATDQIINLLKQSKFYEQIHLVLIDGLAFGGFNLIDLPRLTEKLEKPCVAVMRKPPDIKAVKKALAHFNDCDKRTQLIADAGEIHQAGNFFFQVINEEPHIIGQVLRRISDQGHVPEALRLAHLIGSAVILGQSGKRA